LHRCHFPLLHGDGRYDDLREALPEYLANATAAQPLVVVLDSLDQFSDENKGREGLWLPAQTPPFCRLVLSTLPDDKYGVMPGLRHKYGGEGEVSEMFLRVQPLAAADGPEVLEKLLARHGRSATETQRAAVLSRFEETGCLPLFLRLASRAAGRWRSYDDDATTAETLGRSVRDLINQQFHRVERRHGQLLVQRALGYISVSRKGLTQDELLAVLNADVEVTDFCFQ